MATAQRDNDSSEKPDLDLLAVDVANEIADLEAQDVQRPGIEALRRVWKKYCLTVGHWRLGRALLGRYECRKTYPSYNGPYWAQIQKLRCQSGARDKSDENRRSSAPNRAT